MLKEYRFNLNYEYYPFKDKPKETIRYVNGHKVSREVFNTLFNKVKSILPIDNTYTFIWNNHKTGSYTKNDYYTFNKETYDY